MYVSFASSSSCLLAVPDRYSSSSSHLPIPQRDQSNYDVFHHGLCLVGCYLFLSVEAATFRWVYGKHTFPECVVGSAHCFYESSAIGPESYVGSNVGAIIVGKSLV